jgi:hypothetical protein
VQIWASKKLSLNVLLSSHSFNGPPWFAASPEGQARAARRHYDASGAVQGMAGWSRRETWRVVRRGGKGPWPSCIIIHNPTKPFIFLVQNASFTIQLNPFIFFSPTLNRIKAWSSLYKMEDPLPPLVVRSRLADGHKLSMWRCHPVWGGVNSEKKRQFLPFMVFKISGTMDNYVWCYFQIFL